MTKEHPFRPLFHEVPDADMKIIYELEPDELREAVEQWIQDVKGCDVPADSESHIRIVKADSSIGHAGHKQVTYIVTHKT